MSAVTKLQILLLAVVLAVATGCAKRVRFDSLPLAGAGSATATIQLTYNRNDRVEVELSKVPDPSALKGQPTHYVLWVATQDRQHIINLGQLRVENNKAKLQSVTPLRKFTLFITAEASGDAMTPGPDILFQSKEISW